MKSFAQFIGELIERFKQQLPGRNANQVMEAMSAAYLRSVPDKYPKECDPGPALSTHEYYMVSFDSEKFLWRISLRRNRLLCDLYATDAGYLATFSILRLSL